MIVSETYGGLPEILLDGSERDDAPLSIPLRRFAPLPAPTRMMGLAACAACMACTTEERLEAAETALELLAGLANFGVGFIYR
ncbi:hypothetical protein ABT096_40580 [Streptomyces sp. NPDC002561]|uniref:hypothetical protein n=1 Tax=unclassified Streptomyces TaxID=2593676 RepID=UPI0011E77A81|nr:hypothetical protein [Streptomyces sp. sk2.1]